MKHSVSALLLLASTQLGWAESNDFKPDGATITIAAYHENAKRDFETFIPGALIRWDILNYASVNAGVFRNSFGKWAPTVLGCSTYPIVPKFDIGTGGCLGATRYDKWRLMGNLHVKSHGVSVNYTPTFGKFEETDDIWSLSYGFDF